MVGEVQCEIEEQTASKDLVFLVLQIFGLQPLKIPTSLTPAPILILSRRCNPFASQKHYIPQDHTGENIKEALSNGLLQLNLDQSKQLNQVGRG